MSTALKNYYLYLDESGNFGENREDGNTPPSLVGGVFFDSKVRKRADPQTILTQIARDPDFLAASGGIALEVNHCADLPAEVKIPARLRVIEWCAEQGMSFVFFRSGAHIVDPTKTYLNLLVEGLVQFLAHLSCQGSAKLTVVIGRRVDTVASRQNVGAGGPVTQIIEAKEYQNRMEERVAIAKARYLFDAANQISYEITFDSDKSNPFLVLSDYVCSCRHTMDFSGQSNRCTWNAYQEPAADGRSYRAVLEELFRTRGSEYGFLEDQFQQDVRRNLSSRAWGSALFLALSQGMPKQELAKELQAAFQRFDGQDQRTQMAMFFNLTGNLLHARNGLGSEDAICLLEAYLTFLDGLPIGLESLRSFCQVNARLYLSTAYTHCGRSGQANAQLDRCETALPELLSQPENLELYYILRNRQAIVRQDCYRYDKALELLEEAVSVAELQQESQGNLFGLLGYSVERQPSEQHAKLLGSLALTYQYMLPSHPELSEKARDAASRAIGAMRLPQDQQRHYMTLAEIELCGGQLDEAHRHFCMGLGCKPGAALETLNECRNRFDWYHAIRFADGLCRGNKEQRALAEKLFALIHERFDTVFGEAYPVHSAARRAGALCLKLGKSYAKAARAYFERCESLCFGPEQDTLYAIGLASMAERILADLHNGKGVGMTEKQFRDRCAQAEKRAQIPELQVFFRELAQGSEAAADKQSKVGFYRSVIDRVGH